MKLLSRIFRPVRMTREDGGGLLAGAGLGATSMRGGLASWATGRSKETW